MGYYMNVLCVAGFRMGGVSKTVLHFLFLKNWTYVND